MSRKTSVPKSETVDDNAVYLTDGELDWIRWRATRGSHFEEAFLINSKYAQQVIEEDVPRLIAEIRRLRDIIEAHVAAEVEQAKQEGRLWK